MVVNKSCKILNICSLKDQEVEKSSISNLLYLNWKKIILKKITT